MARRFCATDGSAGGHEGVEMRLSQLASRCLCVALVAVLVSCNGLIKNGGSACEGSYDGSYFGDCNFDGGGPPPTPTGSFDPGPAFDGPGACSVSSIGEPGPADQCVPDRGPWGSGEV